ncbi:MAG: hypothetical protein ACYC4L_21205 [Chloroflexota bacterium]
MAGGGNRPTTPEGQRNRTAERRAPPEAHGSPGTWWQQWAPYVAAIWSLAYGALGLYWAGGGAGFPFGESDPGAVFSILGAVGAEAAPVVAVLSLTGAVVALLMAATSRSRRGGPLRVVLLAYAWTATAILLLVVPDARALVAVAYAPVVLLGAPFGWPPGDYRNAIPWPVLNQFVCIAGGVAWAATAFAYQRRTRPGPAPGWTLPEEAACWGRWATGIAVIVPLVYAATRLAWALGIPLGLNEEFFRQGQAEGTFAAGASLAAVAIVGSALTLGLVQRWGEVFPHWLPGVGGRPVPPALAVVPASIVAVLVTNAGLTFWRRVLLGTTSFSLTGGDWAALAPELLWPLWGVALGAATLAYYLRRRPVHNAPGRPVVEVHR